MIETESSLLAIDDCLAFQLIRRLAFMESQRDENHVECVSINETLLQHKRGL